MTATNKKPRKTDRDTEKVGGVDIMAIGRWAKSNPWVLALIAGGGGFGGEQISALVGQPVEAKHIIAAILAFALLDVFNRMLKRLDKIEERLADGTEVMERHDQTLAELLAWREDCCEEGGKKVKKSI